MGQAKKIYVTGKLKGEKGDTGERGVAGEPGLTPYIGENGNWYLGDTDTGKPSVDRLYESDLEAEGSMATLESPYIAPFVERYAAYGRSEQDGTPSLEEPIEITSVGDGGSFEVRATGKNLVDATDIVPTSSIYVNRDLKVFPGVQYSFKFFAPFIGITSDAVACMLKNSDGSTIFRITDYVNSINGRNNATNSLYRFEVSENIAKEAVTFSMYINAEALSGYIGNEWYAALCVGDGADVYEPYQATTATITTGLPLHGIPVESGGNVTIDGQEYIADVLEVDADGSGQVVRYLYDGVITGNEPVYSSPSDWPSYPYNYYVGVDWGINGANESSARKVLSSHFLSEVNAGNPYKSYGYAACYSRDSITFTFTQDSGIDTNDKAKAWLTEQYNNGNPVRVIAQRETPEIIPLTRAEVEAVIALDTCKPVTNITNDAEAMQKVVYSALPRGPRGPMPELSQDIAADAGEADKAASAKAVAEYVTALEARIAALESAGVNN